jgi:hypothetical protein
MQRNSRYNKLFGGLVTHYRGETSRESLVKARCCFTGLSVSRSLKPSSPFERAVLLPSKGTL